MIGHLSVIRAAIDRYLLSAGRPAANLPHAVVAVDRWDRQTDGHMPHSMRAASTSNWLTGAESAMYHALLRRANAGSTLLSAYVCS